MKCPLLWASVLNSPRQVKEKHGDCIKEECAWWYENDQCCAITNIARDSTLFLLAFQALVNKMPHEEQFRK